MPAVKNGRLMTTALLASVRRFERFPPRRRRPQHGFLPPQLPLPVQRPAGTHPKTFAHVIGKEFSSDASRAIAVRGPPPRRYYCSERHNGRIPRPVRQATPMTGQGHRAVARSASRFWRGVIGLAPCPLQANERFAVYLVVKTCKTGDASLTLPIGRIRKQRKTNVLTVGILFVGEGGLGRDASLFPCRRFVRRVLGSADARGSALYP